MNGEKGFAFNVTRQAFLATELSVANTHLQRLLGLLRRDRQAFTTGRGLLIVPSHGVHTLGLRVPIDVVYLDARNCIIDLHENVRPWRFTPMRMDAATVLELPIRTIMATGSNIGDQVEISYQAAQRTDAETVTAGGGE
jgi:uncharacterized membrane protein (UPF0127 family)